MDSPDTHHPLRLLSPDGVLLSPEEAADPDLAQQLELVRELDAGQLGERYRQMALTRRLDLEAASLQRQGELALWISCAGQEAAQVGAAQALREQDHVFPSYREHALAMARGVDPLDLMRLLRGATHGGWDPTRHGFHIYTLVIGAQLPHAVGYAMGMRHDAVVGTGDPSRDAAVLACFGDGASSQGEANESLNWASVMKAPVVFFCQNNGWAISAPASLQSAAPIYQRAAGFGMPGVQVDGNDVLAVEAVVRATADRARAGMGPSLVEAVTYRMSPHTSSDDATRYRTREEEQSWRRLDPLTRLEKHLRETHGTGNSFFDGLREEAEELALRVRRGVREMADPAPETIFDHVYASEHALLSSERTWLEEWNRTESEEQR